MYVSENLMTKDAKAVQRALQLLDKQIPGVPVKKMQQVPIWFSPKYDDAVAGGVYHPNVKWLISHGLRKALAKAVEFTNIPIFKKEIKRMQ